MASHQIHALGGIAAGGATLGGLHHWLGRPLEPVGASLFLLVGVLAALFPDVDTESRGRDIFYGIFFLLDLVLIGFKQYTLASRITSRITESASSLASAERWKTP